MKLFMILFLRMRPAIETLHAQLKFAFRGTWLILENSMPQKFLAIWYMQQLYVYTVL